MKSVTSINVVADSVAGCCLGRFTHVLAHSVVHVMLEPWCCFFTTQNNARYQRTVQCENLIQLCKVVLLSACCCLLYGYDWTSDEIMLCAVWQINVVASYYSRMMLLKFVNSNYVVSSVCYDTLSHEFQNSREVCRVLRLHSHEFTGTGSVHAVCGRIDKFVYSLLSISFMTAAQVWGWQLFGCCW